jgi:Protein of unknown function (DUF2975)
MEVKVEKIQRVSSILWKLLWVPLLGYPLFVCLAWLFPETEFVKSFSHVIAFYAPPSGDFHGNPVIRLDPALLSVGARGIGFAGSILDTLFVCAAAILGLKLLRLYQKGIIFSEENTRFMSGIGWCVLLYGVVGGLFVRALWGVASTFDNPIGQRFLTLSLSEGDFKLIFAGVFILLITWVMREGVKLQQEQELTV